MKQSLLAKTIIIAHVMVIAVAVSWRAVEARPTATPPTANRPAPLRTDSRADTKAGPLTISNTLSATTATVSGSITTQSLCLPNGGCYNTWPSLSQPNWNFQDVLYQTNGNIQNRYLDVYSITLNGSNRTSWPSWNSSSYGSTYWQSTGNGYASCSGAYFMVGVGYFTGGGLASIMCAQMNLQ